MRMEKKIERMFSSMRPHVHSSRRALRKFLLVRGSACFECGTMHMRLQTSKAVDTLYSAEIAPDGYITDNFAMINSIARRQT